MTIEADSQRKAVEALPVPVTVLAWLYIGLAMAGLIAGGCFCLQLWLIPGWFGDTFLAFAIPIFIFLSMILFLPALVGGIGLLRRKTWARIIIFLLSLVTIFLFPIGTILGAFGILALRADHTLPAGPVIEGGAPHFRASRSASLICGTFLGLAGFGSTCTIVMGLVFRDRPDVSPVSAQSFDNAVIILTGVAMATALWFAVSWIRFAQGDSYSKKNVR